jgi:hypothetical protein
MSTENTNTQFTPQSPNSHPYHDHPDNSPQALVVALPSNSLVIPTSPNVNPPEPKPEPVLKYDEIDYTKINHGHIEKKTAESPNGKINYMQISYSYNYGTPEVPKREDFTFEGPELTSYGGLQKKVEGSKVTYSINVALPETLRREDHRGFLDTLDYLNQYIAHVINQNKVELNKPYFDVDKPQILMKPIIYTPIDKATATPIPGAMKSTYFKVNKTGGFIVKPTLFTLPGGTALTDWTLLEDVEIKFIPKLKLVSTFIGAATMMSSKIEIVSAVILSIIPRNSVSTQLDTIEKHKHLDSLVQEQIKKVQSLKSSNITVGPKPTGIVQDQNVASTQMTIGFPGSGAPQQQGQSGGFKPSFPGLPAPASAPQQPAYRPPSSASNFYANSGVYQQQ